MLKQVQHDPFGDDSLSYSLANMHGPRMTISTLNANFGNGVCSRPSRARARRTVNIVNFREISR